MLDVKSHFICGKPKIYEKAEIVKTVTLQKQFFWDSIVVKIFKQSKSEDTALYIVVLEYQYQRRKRGYPSLKKAIQMLFLIMFLTIKLKMCNLIKKLEIKSKANWKPWWKKIFFIDQWVGYVGSEIGIFYALVKVHKSIKRCPIVLPQLNSIMFNLTNVVIFYNFYLFQEQKPTKVKQKSKVKT